ncbi:MAG: DUF1638 domain-containing protein [Phycisphaerae bacterium]|nr:DUF1638 domain-containing protein [Phycisphaerae bacterium]
MLYGISKVHVIACGVLGLDLREVAARLSRPAKEGDRGLSISLEFLPGGLHSTPRELRRRLQEAIDQASAERKGELICLGYGVCGLGAVGLHARNIPLAVPRVNDCIALFLGSDTAYRKQFAAYPGTYYIAAGWVEEKTPPPNSKSPQACRDAETEYQRLVEQHGPENAQAIRYFLSSWQRNYQRAAFIDTGVDAKRGKYADIAQAMASDYGWKYEALTGTHSLLEALILERYSGEEILLVPPHYVTSFDAAARKLAAVPVWQQATTAAPSRVIVIDGEEAAGSRDEGVSPSCPADILPAPAGEGDLSSSSDPNHGTHNAGGTPASRGSALPPARLGLGIDAGGTYTDVALYDFERDTILQKAKAPTTKWDYCVGIEEALASLDPATLARVDLVSVSTTLATNAIVEGHGQKVGLLVLPPYGMYWPEDFDYQPVAPIEGQLDINGAERTPVNLEQVAAVARTMVREHQVRAFAVSGFASHANPAHELAVKAVIRRETGLGVTCGHEVSQGLSYKVRADTAMLNARIIPYLEKLLEQLQQSLARRAVTAPIMVVRSDGSLMSVQTAVDRPIETMLSGPAASVAGARYLAKCDDALVVDIGGTTTDTAVISGGRVQMCDDGASVGGWRTHVRALDMRTLGLGGDSLIAHERRKLRIGPRRVEPVGSLARRHNLAAALEWVEHHLDHFDDATAGMELLFRNEHGLARGEAVAGLDEPQRRIVEELAGGPLSAHELSRRLGYVSDKFMPLAGLEAMNLIQRSGLTPTDLLHAQGQLSLWAGWACERYAGIFGRLLGLDQQTFAERALGRFVELLTMELFKTRLSRDVADADEMDRSPTASAMMKNVLAGGGEGYDVQVRVKSPIVGIGAPVGFFLSSAAGRLGTKGIVPPNADVANAVGAITSLVTIRRQVEIVPNDHGRYTVEGLPDAPAFAELEAAQSHAVDRLRVEVLAAALANGTSQRRLEVAIRDRVATVTDGGQIFIGRVLEATLTGRPDLAR